VNDTLDTFEGVLPLRRTLTRRRKRSGLPGLIFGALVRAVLLVGLPVAIVVWLLYSPYFLIREVHVEGGSRVSAAWVQENLRPLAGRHILGVSLDGVRRRLSADPWVASVELRRELPDRLSVVVVERQPAALLATENGLFFLDAAGEPIAPCPTGGGEGLLRVRTSFAGPAPVAEVLDVVGELQRAEPAWGLGVRMVEVLGEGEFRLASEPLPFPLLVKAGEVGEGVANLRQVLPEVTRRWRGIGSVDLRLPRRLVVQHAGEMPPAPPVVAAAVPAASVPPQMAEPQAADDGGVEAAPADFQSSAAVRGAGELAPPSGGTTPGAGPAVGEDGAAAAETGAAGGAVAAEEGAADVLGDVAQTPGRNG
jgi:cell division septal protein FtsQ